MSISVKLSRLFPSKIQKRGGNYFSAGAVTINHGSDDSVEATVRGGSVYEVSLTIEERDFHVDCTCPYMDDSTSPCKHIWATILAAEKHGHLKPLERQAILYLHAGKGSYLREDLEDIDDDIEKVSETVSRALRPVVQFPTAKADSNRLRPIKAAKKPPPAPPIWKTQLDRLGQAMEPSGYEPLQVWPSGRQILYMVDVPATTQERALVLDVLYRDRKQNGDWGKPKAQSISSRLLPMLPNVIDQEILSILKGAREEWDSGYYYGRGLYRYHIPQLLWHILLPKICESGRLFLSLAYQTFEPQPLRWDDGSAWEFWLEGCAESPEAEAIVIRGSLRREREQRDLSEPVVLLPGLVFDRDRVALLNDFGAFSWVSTMRQIGSLQIPRTQSHEFFQQLLELPQQPRLDLPEQFKLEEVVGHAQPHLQVRAAKRRYYGPERLEGLLQFSYDGVMVSYLRRGRAIFHPEKRCLILRDLTAEQAALDYLRQNGFRHPPSYYESRPELELPPKKLPAAVRALVGAGWHVEAEGKLYRQPGAFNMAVSSGIDWFELDGRMHFGDQIAKLPALLAALQRGESMVRLDDGTFGLLPEEWLKKFGTLASVGTSGKERVRFSQAQIGFLDALLTTVPEATFDEVFAKARNELSRFDGVEPLQATDGFVGALRGYQCEGLGWFRFLQRFGFGGCLADDMGLGKTVQVLALLESRRANGTARSQHQKNDPHRVCRPSLVVVPRSLVFNWKQEAARFTPTLRVLDYTGSGRSAIAQCFDDRDLVITTYGTLRRDAALLKDIPFDYVILDEAQAIKNASTESAKAARLLRGEHRLALSGTPVENHLGELWSLFEFLNPGLLGTASVFRLSPAGARNPDPETRALLSKALRPFILRRTKAQVARDLPEKLEQTLYCELDTDQRRLYDELRDYYRGCLLQRIEQEGIQKAKILVLEALLRLRQAACHPGLVDRSRTSESSSKLEVLLAQLGQVIDEGHKALVFSQFTSLLAIVRARLDQERSAYEYLDGKTRDRAAKVERFQTDPNCKLFLISLKAGGLGLNLTAAEYVYLLDPWWNPAVEAQAIDRTHRIGQSRRVFAYRLIARNTVEEKVLELQKSKRELADAILNEDHSLIRSLQREDLELLLG